MSIFGTPSKAPEGAPKVPRRSLVKATVRKDMAQIPPDVAATLLERYRNQIEYVIRKYGTRNLLGVDREDLRAIAQVAVFEAYVIYREKASASERTWVCQVIRWRVAEAVNIARAGSREVLTSGQHGSQDRWHSKMVGEDAAEDVATWGTRQTRSLQATWLTTILKRHFTAEERRILLGNCARPEDPKARARLKQRRYKIRERLMQLAEEAGVIQREREDGRFRTHLTEDVPLLVTG